MKLFHRLFHRSPAEFVHGSGWIVEVVGEAQYQGELRKQSRRVGGTKHDVQVRAVLVPDDADRFDGNAVRVEIGGDLVGFLTPERAAEYRRAVGNVSGACSAKIIGGREVEKEGRARCVRLNLTWPPRFAD
jgi:hypothetical protein